MFYRFFVLCIAGVCVVSLGRAADSTDTAKQASEQDVPAAVQGKTYDKGPVRVLPGEKPAAAAADQGKTEDENADSEKAAKKAKKAEQEKAKNDEKAAADKKKTDDKAAAKKAEEDKKAKKAEEENAKKDEKLAADKAEQDKKAQQERAKKDEKVAAEEKKIHEKLAAEKAYNEKMAKKTEEEKARKDEKLAAEKAQADKAAEQKDAEEKARQQVDAAKRRAIEEKKAAAEKAITDQLAAENFVLAAQAEEAARLKALADAAEARRQMALESTIHFAIRRLTTSGWREAQGQLVEIGKPAVPYLIEAMGEGAEKPAYVLGGHDKADAGHATRRRSLAEMCSEVLTDMVSNHSDYRGELPAVDQAAWRKWWQAHEAGVTIGQ